MAIEDHRLEAFLAGAAAVVQVARIAQEKIDRRLATNFSIFEVLRTGEHALSNLLRELLDPAGRHGQGDMFLKEFLWTLGVPEPFNAGPCRVTRELLAQSGSASRPLDIMVEFENATGGIAIENKPWARDQYGQMGHYLSYMDKRFGENFWMVIYLSAYEAMPTSVDVAEWQAFENRKKAMVLPYIRSGVPSQPSLESWLDRCAERCESDYVKAVVRDLGRFLREEFSSAGVREGTMSGKVANDVIAEYILGNDSNLECACAIERAMERVRRILIQALLDGLRNYVLEELGEGWEACTDGNYGIADKYSNLVFRRVSWPKRKALVGTAIEASKRGWNDVVIGIRAHQGEIGCDRRALKEIANILLPESEYNEWWPAFQYLPDPFRDWQGEVMRKAGLRCHRGEKDVPEIREIGDRLVTLARHIAGKLDPH